MSSEKNHISTELIHLQTLKKNSRIPMKIDIEEVYPKFSKALLWTIVFHEWKFQQWCEKT